MVLGVSSSLWAFPTRDLQDPAAPAAVNAVPAVTPNQILQLVNDQLLDLKTNTRFHLDSFRSMSVFDNSNGRWLLGTEVPFADIGSHIDISAGLAKAMQPDAKGVPLLGAEFSLDPVTRPIATKLLSKFTNNQTLIDNVAKAATVGYTAGHDFNLPGKDKVVFNTVGVNLGLTVKFN